MKIDETWSIEVLRVVAFSQGVVAPFQERLVNDSRGWSSLPREAGKRAQVGACMLVGVCASTYVVRCFLYNKILKAEQRQRWFSPDLGFHLKSWCSCVMVYYVLTAHVYCLLNIDE